MIAIPKSTASACVLSSGKEELYEIFMRKYSKYKKQNEKDQQTIKSFDKIYKKSLQVILIDKKEYDTLGNTFSRYFDETKIEFF